MVRLEDAQLFQIAIAYQDRKSDISAEDFLESVASDYETFQKLYKKKRVSRAKVGNKDLLGLP